MKVVVLTTEELEALIKRAVAMALREHQAAVGEPYEYMSTKQAAEMLGMSHRSLEGLRLKGEGPPFIRIGNAVRYRLSELQRYGKTTPLSRADNTGG